MTRISKVSVGIVSWNGRRHLEACLPALADQRDPGVPWEVVVLDNGSRDGTAAWIREHHPRVRLIESPVNLGFCAGNNRIVEAASGDAVAFLNNDTRPDPGWLGGLVEALSAAPSDVAAVSGQIIDWKGERLDFARGVMTFDGHAFQLDFRRPLAQVEVPAAGEELLFACGGNMLIRRRSFLEAGGFDRDYFAYLEDVDLGWRLWSGGERVVFTPAARVHHRSSATSDLLGLYNRGFLFERNAFLTAYKNYDEELWGRLMPAVLLTLSSRTQSLLEGANPGGGRLALDPYAGHIADTGNGAESPVRHGSAPPPAPVFSPTEMRRRLRDYGPLGLLRQAIARLRRDLAARRPSNVPETESPRLTDERTIAQLRAQSYLLGHLDQALVKRRAIQARRRRSDREIFERFPLYVVPTYPGDEELFAGEGFRSWLPDDLPLVRRTLTEVMCFGE